MERIARIDCDVVKSSVRQLIRRNKLPGLSAIGGSKQTDAEHALVIAFTGARVGDVRRRGCGTDRTHGKCRLLVGQRPPALALVARFPKSAAAGTQHQMLCVRRRSEE